jgi:hypothetical protein
MVTPGLPSFSARAFLTFSGAPMKFLKAIGLLALCAGFGFSQEFSSLTAHVQDSSGAAIVGVSVDATNLDTSSKRSATTDGTGAAVFVQMSPGRYKVTSTMAGFSTASVDNVVLVVNTPATLNIEMKVGGVTETVEITAEAALVNTTDASLGTAITNTAIVELPFEARNPATLIALQPGVTFFGNGLDYGRPNGTPNTSDRLNGSVNGSKPDQNNITLDGVDVNDQNSRNAFQSVLRVTLDSVQEFRTTTQNPTAEQGRGSGAQIALVTKSGTNTLHGSLYEYNRNTSFTANDFFRNRSGIPRQKLIRNIFGVSGGGPIKKDRLFFFGNYEGRRDRSEETAARTVPTASLRAGTVRYFNSSGGISTRTQAQLQQDDPAHIGVDPAVLAVLNQYPVPNDDTLGDGLNTSGFRFKYAKPLDWNTYLARMDYTIDSSSRNTLFWRGNLQNDDVGGTVQLPGEAGAKQLDNSKGYAVGWTSVLSPRLVNTVRYGYTRSGHESATVQSGPYVSFRGIDTLHSTAKGTARIIPVNQIGDDAAWTLGKHDLKFGGVVRTIRNKSNNFLNSFANGSTPYSYLAGTGGSLRPADLLSTFSTSYRAAAVDLLGPVSFATITYNYKLDGSVLPQGAPVQRQYNQNEYELYINDNFRFRRDLTINLGLRYTLAPTISEDSGYLVSPTLNLHDWWVNREALGDQGKSQALAGTVGFVLGSSPGALPLYPTQKKNFSPRIALAYSPEATSRLGKMLFGDPGKTSIRAGFGMFYDIFGMGLIRQYDSTAPGLSTNLQTAANANLATAPRFTGYNNFPFQLLGAAPKFGFPFTPDLGGFAITNSIDPAIKQPYTMNLNFTVSREMKGGLVLTTSYVGRLSRRTITTQDLAQPTNLKDPKSGIRYIDAINELARAGRANTPVSQIKTNAFWEDLYPTYADPKNGLTATQGMYLSEFFKSSNVTDLTSATLDIDNDCSGTGGCSVLGPNAIFNGQYSALFAMSSVGHGNYHGLQVSLEKRFSRGSLIKFNYSWSHSTDLTSNAENDFTNGSYGTIINSYDRYLNKGSSDFDIRHQVNGFAVLALPVGKGHRLLGNANKFVQGALGGWELSTLYQITSGLPRSIFNSGSWPTNWNFSGFATQTGPSPDQTTTKNAPGINGQGGPNFFPDPSVAIKSYEYTYAGQIGQRNGIRGDGFFTIDLNLAKKFVMPYSEHHALQIRWEVFNAPNLVRFDINQASLDLGASGTFGKYTGTLNSYRIMQLSARYTF